MNDIDQMGTEIHLNLDVLTCHPLIHTINHLKFIVSTQMEESISVQRVRPEEDQ